MDDNVKPDAEGDEPSLEELLSNLPPILPLTHSRFPSAPSKTFLDAIAGAQPIDIDSYESEEADRLFEFVEKISGPI